jgi:hypothetical protein
MPMTHAQRLVVAKPGAIRFVSNADELMAGARVQTR